MILFSILFDVLFALTAVLLAVLAAVASFGCYFYFVRHKLTVENVRICIGEECPPRGNEELILTVAHLSDFHYDFGNEERMDVLLEEALRALDQIQPALDLILLTGDYVNHDARPIVRFCRGFASKLRGKASLGAFASLGNHDYYGNRRDTPSPFQCSADYISHCLEEAGVTVLRNRMVEAGRREENGRGGGVWICGLEDVWSPPGWGGHRSIMRRLHSMDDARLRLVMSHNPDTAHQLSGYQYDLQLSGHAHGGQICLPASPFVKVSGFEGRHYNMPVLGLLRPVFDWAIPRFALARRILGDMRRKRKYSYVIDSWEWSQGLHCLRHGTDCKKQLYVTRGVGTHRNMRLFCPPELTVLSIIGPKDCLKVKKGT